MENMTIFRQLATTPAEARKTIRGGRLNGFTDINPMWRIKALTEVFGPCGIGWYIEITDTHLEYFGDEVKAFATVNLYWREDWNKPWSAPVTGLGGSSFVAKESKGAYVSDECFKMAVTDAIGSACKLLGMSADIFYANDRTKYTNLEDAAPADPIIRRPKSITSEDVRQAVETGNANEHAVLLLELENITTPDEQKALQEKYGSLELLDNTSLEKLIVKIKRKKETT